MAVKLRNLFLYTFLITTVYFSYKNAAHPLKGSSKDPLKIKRKNLNLLKSNLSVS